MSKYPGNIITSGANAGYSVALDGTGDNLTTATNVSIGTQAFTYELFVYFTASPQGYLIGQGTSGGAAFFYESGVLGLARAFTGNDLTFTTTFTQNTWNHIAVVRSGTGTNQTAFFINGTRVATGTVTSNYSTSAFYIGGFTGATFVTGYISNARIVVGSAVYDPTQTTIRVPTQLFNIPGTQLLTCNSPSIIDQSPNAFAITVNGNAAASTFTPFTGYTAYNPALGASTPGVWTVSEALEARQTRRWNMYDPYFNLTTLLLHGNGTNGAQNNTFLDSSSNNFTITRNGNTTQGTFSPFSQTGWSNFFNGSTDYFYFAAQSGFSFGTGDWAIEAFVYLTSTADQAIYDARPTSTNGLYPLVDTAGGKFRYYTNSASRIESDSTFSTNRWYHIVVSRVSGTTRMFIDGVVQSTTYTDSNNYIVGTNRPTIGIGGFNLTGPLSGYMSNMRVLKGSGYTSVTVPTAPLTAVTNTQLLICQSNRFVDNSANAYAITIAGTPSVQAFSPFYPVVAYTPQAQGGSGYFDGAGDYLLGPSGNVNIQLSGSFTVEAWVYPTTTSGGIFTLNGTSTSGWPGAAGGLAFQLAEVDIGNSTVISYTTPTINTWSHIAVVRNGMSGTNITVYLNGVPVATGSNTSALGNGTDRFGIGFFDNFSGSIRNPFNGYISGLRVVNGSAVYTGAFTVPTGPFTATMGANPFGGSNTSSATSTVLLNFTNAGIVDSTAKNALETAGNAQISTTQSKFGGSSLAFDGTGDYLVARYNPNLEFGSGDFTVECWVYFSTLPSNDFAAITSYGDTDGTPRWIFYYDSRTSQSSPGLRFTVINSSGTAIVDVVGGGTSGWAANTWYHVAITRSGNSWRLFRDGTQTGSTVTDTDAIPAATNNGLYVGSEPTALALLTGYIDDLRITKGYARYTGNFTPQTSQWQDQ